MRVCRKCGTLIPKSMEVCPKCSTVGLEKDATVLEMSEAELKRARMKSWIWIIIGVPALIGVIYLMIYLMALLQG